MIWIALLFASIWKLSRPPDGVWFLGIGGDAADALPDISDLFGRAGATPPWIVQAGGWLGALTSETSWESLEPCLAGCRARGIRAIARPSESNREMGGPARAAADDRA
jgi:hypothetical protein